MRGVGSAAIRSRTHGTSTASRTTSAAHGEYRGRNRLTAACPSTEAFLEKVALHGGHLGGTTTRLLHLLDQYGAAALDAALAEAHRRGAFHAQSVAHVLDQRRRARGAPVPVNVVLPDDPRVRDQVAPSRSLAVYDALGRTQKDATRGGDDE